MPNKFIEEHKKIYKSLKSCFCPTLQETVHFTSDGLNHILYYRRRPRSFRERYYRAALIPCIADVIQNASSAVRRVESEDPLVVTWALKYSLPIKGSKRTVKVILEKRGVSGKLTFLSIMMRKSGDGGQRNKKK